MKHSEVCIVCHLILSLVEEAEKHPYSNGWVHRKHIEEEEKKPKAKPKKHIGFPFDPTEGL